MTHPYSSTQVAKESEWFHRAFTLGGSQEAEALYDEWASGYDADLKATHYASPQRAVEAVDENISPGPCDELKILDAGCGTGLVGDCLNHSALAGKFVLDGADLSTGMLAIAEKKKIYRELYTANLNERIEKPDGTYDVVTCVGTLTKCHVGPHVFAEFARLTASSGLIVATVLAEIWESGGYKAEIERLRDDGAIQIISTDEFGILEEGNSGGIMVVLRKK